ncbi:MAG: hypothetical protein KIC94_12305 [Clostridiales bacterium]|nr:hypothetical protein [Clostridiales bacterium]
MICPYCGGEEHFDNSSINHKYKHNDCNKYFKICSFCETKYVERDNVVVDKSAIEVDNLFEIDSCIKCGKAWLPDFPTSWLRSLTNIGKIYDVLSDCTKINEGEINKNSLLELQRSHNGVTFNSERAKARGVKDYITGALERRMADYILVLRNMQILVNADNGTSPSYKLSEFGEAFAASDDSYEIFAFFITACCNIKINNGFQKETKSSVYKYFRIRYIENILKGCLANQKRGKLTSIEEIGVTILARNEEQFLNRALSYIRLYNKTGLQEKFFNSTNKELNRSVKGAFINILVTLGILEQRQDLYKVTAIGEQVTILLDSYPAIWIDEVLGEDESSTIQNIATVMTWRLLKNNLIIAEELKISEAQLNGKMAEIIPKANEIHDLHFNLLYDEHISTKDDGITYKVLNYMRKNTVKGMDEEKICKLCEKLTYIFFTNVYTIVLENKTVIEPIIENMNSDTFKQNTQSGKKWHDCVRESFIKMGLQALDYREKPIFEKLTIDKLTLNLPGGSVYNPDILIMDKDYGKEGCILVDAKDENSINGEVHKLMGYNTYAHDNRVDTFCIIALRGCLPIRTKTRIVGNIEEFDRIVIIEEKAIEKLLLLKVSSDKIMKLLYPTNGFKLITAGDIIISS